MAIDNIFFLGGRGGGVGVKQQLVPLTNYGITGYYDTWVSADSENPSNEPRHEKTCLCHMWTTKTQISLRIHAVWSGSSLFAA